MPRRSIYAKTLCTHPSVTNPRNPHTSKKHSEAELRRVVCGRDTLLNGLHIRDPLHQRLGAKIIVKNAVGKLGVDGSVLQGCTGSGWHSFEHQIVPLASPAAMILPEPIENFVGPPCIEPP